MQSKNSVAIHQWLPGFASGDAISNDAIAIQNEIRKWGYESSIFCPGRHVAQKVRPLYKDWDTYPDYSNQDNIVIYHFSIGSPLSEIFRKIPDKKILIYHNITPDKYFRSVSAEKAMVLKKGREELKTLRDVPQLALADSEYNRLELEEWGYKNTGVIPPFIDFSGLSGKPDKSILNRHRDDWVNILFVGRMTPNKKIEDVIRVFYYYKNSVNPKSRLFLVGAFIEMDKYFSYLRSLILELNLRNVIFTNLVNTQELSAYYKLSNIFLCMSEHEGFCIPLVESMYFGIPIIAYSAAAVPYTLGRSGVLVNEKDYTKIAELIDLITTNKEMRKKIIDGQNERLKYFSSDRIGKEFKNYIEKLV